MRYGVAERLEAAAEIAVVLFLVERLQRFESAVARPVVIIEHRPQVLHVHRITFAEMRRSSRGNARSRYALPPSNSGCWLPARIPPPEVSPYSLFSASATSIPSTTSPNGVKPCAS